MEDHVHGEDGHVVIVEPDPVAEETAAVETAAEADVEVAKIEADRDVELAKISAKTAETYASEELAELRGELRGLREIVERLAPPEPEPEPDPVPEPEPVVVVDDSAPEPESDDVPPPAEAEKPKSPKKKSSNPWW